MTERGHLASQERSALGHVGSPGRASAEHGQPYSVTQSSPSKVVVGDVRSAIAVQRETRLPSHRIVFVRDLDFPSSVHPHCIPELAEILSVVRDTRLVVASDDQTDALPGVSRGIDDGTGPAGRRFFRVPEASVRAVVIRRARLPLATDPDRGELAEVVPSVCDVDDPCEIGL